MGIASLVLGVISLVIGWIPFICFIAFITAVAGLILGIVDCVKKNKTNEKSRGFSIAGLTISAISIPIIIIMSIASLGIIVAITEEYDDDYRYHYDEHYDDYDYDFDDWYDRYYDRTKNF